MRRILAPVLAVLLASSGVASAQPREADAHFKHGVELYKDNDYAAALVEFRRAYELDPKFQVLYNIAEASFQLQDYATALRTFQKYLNEGGSKISNGRRAEVEKELEKLKKRVARLEVVTSEPGASVTIDDVAIGTTPLEEALLVSAGRRKITASKTGRAPVTQVVEIAGGDTRTVKLTIPSASQQNVVLVQPAREQPVEDHGVPVIPWVVTGALAAGATVTGILAIGASSDLKDKLKQFPGNADAISSARSKDAALAVVTDTLIGSTIVAGGLAGYLTYKRTRPTPTQGSQPAAPSARLVIGPGSAAITGSF